jgi:anti-sigma factor RsiW
MNSKNGSATEPVIARDATYYRAPDALRERIRASIRAQGREQPRRPLFWAWGGMAAAVAAASVLSWNLALMQVAGGDGDGLAREIASAHVRSLLAENHLSDVISTDQHTVKPWFQGKLDFAPQVTDFSSSGFPLAGGRLDYIDGRPVAALVYRHRLHVVNLFEWPAANPAAATAPELVTRNGYSLVRWKRGGLEYWLVSDAAGVDLLKFAQLIAAS